MVDISILFLWFINQRSHHWGGTTLYQIINPLTWPKPSFFQTRVTSKMPPASIRSSQMIDSRSSLDHGKPMGNPWKKHKYIRYVTRIHWAHLWDAVKFEANLRCTKKKKFSHRNISFLQDFNWEESSCWTRDGWAATSWAFIYNVGIFESYVHIYTIICICVLYIHNIGHQHLRYAGVIPAVWIHGTSKILGN